MEFVFYSMHVIMLFGAQIVPNWASESPSKPAHESLGVLLQLQVDSGFLPSFVLFSVRLGVNHFSEEP